MHQAGKLGEGTMEISVLLSFNKLKDIKDRAGLGEADATAMVSPLSARLRPAGPAP